MAEPTVALIGLGNMGLPMGTRLLGAGLGVVGSDLSAGARDAFVAAGGSVAATPAAAASNASTVILMLPDSTIVESVVDALGDALSPGTLVIDMSSSEPLRSRALAGRLATRGIRFVDAPVSGGVRGAEAGTLTIMVGGEPEHTAEASALLEPLGRVVMAGPVGAGHAAKALNNLLSATHFWATAEAVEVARRFGIATPTLLDIVNGSSGRSGSTENKWPNFVVTGGFDSGFAAGLMLKDMRIALGLADGVGADTELAARAVELWTAAVADLGPTADHTSVAPWVAEHLGGDATAQ